MDISENVKNLHGYFSKANERFLEFVKHNPQLLQRSNFKIMELRDEVFRLQPWPTYLSRQRKEEMASAGVGVFNLIKKIPSLVFGNDPEKISRYYQLPVDEVKQKIRRLDDQSRYMVGRGDFIFTGSGWKCIEYNVTPNLGGWQSPLWEPLYLNHPLISKFNAAQRLSIQNKSLIELFFDFIIGTYLDGSGPSKSASEINIAFHVEKILNLGEHLKIYLKQLYKKKVQAIDPRLKGELIFCHYRDLDIKNHRILHKETEVNVLVWLGFQVIPAEVIDVFERGNVELCNGPVSDILSSKLNLSLLSENEDSGLFTPQEEKLIRDYIPWGRKLLPGTTTYHGEKVEMEDFVHRHQDNLVLKPAVGYGGDGILIGHNTSPEEWRSAISTGFEQQSWLIQEHVETPYFLYQNGPTGSQMHTTVWGFFVAGSTHSGQWVRVMPDTNKKGIINCHQGAEVSVVFEVGE